MSCVPSNQLKMEEEEEVARKVGWRTGGWGRNRSGRMIAEVNVPT